MNTYTVQQSRQAIRRRVGTWGENALAGLVWVLFATSSFLSGNALAVDTRVEVKISGVENELLDNVRAFLSIAELEPEKSLLPLPLPGTKTPEHTDSEVRRLHRRAEKEIRQALQPFGYYEPIVTSSLTRIDDRWIAEYRIATGPPVVLQAIDIRVEGPGREEASIKKVLETIELETGQRLEHARYETAKKDLLDAALAAGYLDARYTRSELRVSQLHKRADIVLILDTGAQYFFGDINIEQDILRPELVARYVKLRPGTPFDARLLLDLQLALSDSGYFSRVEVRVDRKRAVDFRIPVTVETEPAKPRRYGIGAGFGTDTGPRLSLAAEFRRLNRRGHSILTELRTSRIKNSIGLQYHVPIKNVSTDRLLFSAKRESEQVGDDGKSNRTKLGISQNTRWKNYQRRLYINYQKENFDIGDDDDSVTYLIPGASLSRLRSGNLLWIRRGYSWSADLRGSAGQWLSETSFLRGEVAARVVLPLGPRSRLLLRGRAGSTGVEDFSRLPTSERFFAGGDQSVRGYGYQRIGPEDDSGDVVGGRNLLVGSVELDRLFIGNFGAAVFVDSGDAFDSGSPDFKTGAGAGFRWRSPVGMLRIDLAHPFTDTGNNFRLHISIGMDL